MKKILKNSKKYINMIKKKWKDRSFKHIFGIILSNNKDAVKTVNIRAQNITILTKLILEI